MLQKTQDDEVNSTTYDQPRGIGASSSWRREFTQAAIREGWGCWLCGTARRQRQLDRQDAESVRLSDPGWKWIGDHTWKRCCRLKQSMVINVPYTAASPEQHMMS
jgi:hypothetical protein